MTAEDHIHACAALRGQGKFDEAIAEIENNLDKFDEISLAPALIQAFYAAREGGDAAKAKQLAAEIAKHEPDLPALKRYLP